MRVRLVCALTLSMMLVYFTPMAMRFGRALYVDVDYGTPQSTDFVFLGMSTVSWV
jgi:hypothetical protein